MGAGRFSTTTMADFLVVKAHFSYNAIIGRSTMSSLKVVTSTYHLKMKFSTKDDVGAICKNFEERDVTSPSPSSARGVKSLNPVFDTTQPRS